MTKSQIFNCTEFLFVFMKLLLPIVCVMLVCVDLFCSQTSWLKLISSTLPQGRFASKPSYGIGGGVTKKALLDEQWETQQEILQARQGRTEKEYLKRKYAPKAKANFPSRTEAAMRTTPADNYAQYQLFSWADE